MKFLLNFWFCFRIGRFFITHRVWVHDELMTNSNYSEVGLTAYATKIGLDMDAYAACTADPGRHAEEIMNDLRDGGEAGVNGTPAFFINGVFLNGAQPKEQFVAVIERELENAG